jgi:uncharacterized protein
VEGSSVALVGALGVIAGAIIGFFIARFSGSSNAESELVATREALDLYRADVAEHFKRSSGLIAEMTNSYRNVYQHMADGAQQLCSAEVARSIGETLQTERLEDKREPTPPAAPAQAAAATAAASSGSADEAEELTQGAAEGGAAAAADTALASSSSTQHPADSAQGEPEHSAASVHAEAFTAADEPLEPTQRADAEDADPLAAEEQERPPEDVNNTDTLLTRKAS